MITEQIKNKGSMNSGVMAQYSKKVCTPQEAVADIKSGDNVVVHSNCAFPFTLIEAMVERKEELRDVTLMHALTIGELPYLEPGMEKHFRHNSFFMGAAARRAVREGRADFTPIYLFEYPILFAKGYKTADVALVHLSPPDEHGFCSYGVEVGLMKTPADKAKKIIAQVNPRMPRTLGDSFIHISRIDKIVEVDAQVPEIGGDQDSLPEHMKQIYETIGQNIAELIENGSTLQMGIGVIPDNVLRFLDNKRDLGVHTEMFSDGLIKLVEQGVVTNTQKGLHNGKIIVGFVLGSQKLYDFVDNNPLIEFHLQEYVNDPFVIAQNKKMVAINSAIEVDLTGQVCSDSIGPNFYSGYGGQVDFIRGATRSDGGKPIISLPSTTKDGNISRIVTALKPGAGVVTNRADVHYVVTEYGVAQLFGKSVRQRVQALIDIAHPKFRDELTHYAKEHKYI